MVGSVQYLNAPRQHLCHPLRGTKLQDGGLAMLSLALDALAPLVHSSQPCTLSRVRCLCRLFDTIVAAAADPCADIASAMFTAGSVSPKLPPVRVAEAAGDAHAYKYRHMVIFE